MTVLKPPDWLKMRSGKVMSVDSCTPSRIVTLNMSCARTTATHALASTTANTLFICRVRSCAGEILTQSNPMAAGGGAYEGEMTAEGIPVINLSLYLERASNEEAARAESRRCAEAFHRFGIICVRDPRVSSADNDR
jgi:hypothetical protein